MVDATGATITQKAKSRKKSNLTAAPVRKAGNQGNFHGPRKAFLETFVESYFTAVKTKKTPQFWGPTYASFHQKFDWRVLLTDPYPEDHTFSLEVDDANLDEASVALKRERVEDVNKVYLLCLYTCTVD
jgi:hypothetical protein